MATQLEEEVKVLTATNKELILSNEAVLSHYRYERPIHEWHAFAFGFVVAVLLAIVLQLIFSFGTDQSTPVFLLASAAFMVLVLPWLAAKSRTVYRVLRDPPEDQLAVVS